MSSPDRAPGRVLGRWLGEAEPRLLGQGMEGAVYEIDDTRVAKVWFAASAERLRRLAAFYDALAAKSFSFSVPRIAEVATVEGWAITIERRLAGDSLASISGVSISEVRRADARAVLVEVVAEIADAGELPAARELPVLDEEMSLFSGPADFPAALAGLAARRIRRFRPVLSGAVDHLAEKAAALAGRLVEIDSGCRALIHGDLVPANIVVDGDGRASAVLDWGFLSTEGDPAFDAAVAAAIFDMYGPYAPRTEQALLDRMRDRMGYDRTAMLVYRAAYSLITANAYDPLGRDGHFAWCVAALNRADITRALLG
jgi:aminoglycoside phosphotransferase (APT) family kinase protein